jgi:glycosyltransferase involved in cell wall biosynthesis
MTRPVALDVSRLMRRARFSTPTGIDRVERAYARYYLEQYDGPVEIVLHMPVMGDRRISFAKAQAFLSRLDAQWMGHAPAMTGLDIAKLVAGSGRFQSPVSGVTIIPSHQHLHSETMLARRRGQGRLVLFIHDAIPSDYPEYARAGGAQTHRRRLTNAASMACGIVVNSEDTAARLTDYVPAGMTVPPLLVAHIGLDPLPAPDLNLTLPDKPYFVVIGTIEPRKNHLLLLHIWRQFAQRQERGQEQGQGVPNLVIVGRRGWENENIIDLLDRSEFLKGHVIEMPDLGDAQLSALVRGSRAVLMPSFAEGYGMPVAEALAAGIPVIASDLPVFREVAGDIPDYRDPMDGAGWAAIIRDYARDDSVLRQQQMARLQGWIPPSWPDHFEKVTAFIDGLKP